MRLLVTSLALSCFAVVGFAQDATEAPVTEITMNTEDDNEDVAVVGIDHKKKQDAPESGNGGCGCGSKSK